MSKSVRFHPGGGSSVSYTTQDEKSWYRLSCIPVCVCIFEHIYGKNDLTQLFKVV